ncbi:hemerythrin family protein [Geobacter sulfurreducens]|jgi:hemerythrin|uniref:Hemerythrin family protein n=1 Tax=Geobacter sulfurreducens (strain ATCC 51573 / DSM 12127 / PCA) TaxID=243231 RepID=Q74GJ0_GEOSL|nr:hemerythrin family protein [Geobacter sulfurreducens]AAR33590.1 hemerythrin family protein [Geobacter sulfurreducens PCA]ADI83091.1 hemerythrin family protein [Geobacter sulfurreducens KN400]AJY69985.1 hemerythrin family protein [Geobacter sulfurreducens]QVW35526.1 hemerythrin family protein [Geobacter sulfurreducens]UAC04349.1 hemerythrin family protein [Geobacter sulfurreducens]
MGTADSSASNSNKASQKFIVWQDSYSVGVPKLDGQHKKIIDLINEVYDYLQGRTGLLDLGRILDDLSTYTQNHFADEEQLLRLAKYPEYEEHKKHHDWMMQRTRSIRSEYREKREDLSWELMDFLKKWWLSHIQSNDARYVPYVK